MKRFALGTVRTACLLLTVALAAQFLQPSTSFAASPSISLSSSAATAGSTITVTGSDFPATSTITITFNGTAVATTPTTVHSTGTGAFSASFVVPSATSPGFYTVMASSSPTAGSATATLQVLSTPTTTLAIQKSVTPSPTVNPGGQLTYQVQVSNTGAATASNVTIVDTLGTGQTLAAFPAGCSVGTTTGGLTTVTCVVSSIGMGTAVIAQILATAGSSGTITNNATAYANNAAQVNATATSVTVSTTPTTSALSVQKLVNVTSGAGSTGYGVGPVQAVPGNTVNYKITVTNNTTTPATNVVVTDVLAPGQTLVISPTLTSPSCTFTGPSNPALSAGTVTCSIGTVSQGTPQSVAITTVVNQGFSGNLTNQASVTSSNLSGPPSNVTVVQVPTTVPVVTTGTLVLCGTVTAFLTNSITVGGTTIVIAPGATITGSTIALTGNFCIIFTLNTAGQATAMVVTPNLALTNVVCGVFTVGTTAGTVIVGGIPLVVIGGATFPAVLVPGQVYCFVLNAAGQAVAVLTTIPTSIRIVPARLSAAEIRTGYQMTRLSRVIDDV